MLRHRTALIDWVRGEDNKDDENKNLSSTDARAYIHGDLLHSRPAVVNYNRTAGDRDVVVYYGTNDGIFRAVKGGQDDADGWEKWGIVFPEFFGKLKLLRDNDTVIEPAPRQSPILPTVPCRCISTTSTGTASWWRPTGTRCTCTSACAVAAGSSTRST